MSDVDHPHVRLNFDTGNIAYYNKGVDPADELERSSTRAQRPRQGQSRPLRRLVFPGRRRRRSGRLRRVREILDGVGSRPYTIEIEGIGGEPEPGLDGRSSRSGVASPI